MKAFDDNVFIVSRATTSRISMHVCSGWNAFVLDSNEAFAAHTQIGLGFNPKLPTSIAFQNSCCAMI